MQEEAEAAAAIAAVKAAAKAAAKARGRARAARAAAARAIAPAAEPPADAGGGPGGGPGEGEVRQGRAGAAESSSSGASATRRSRHSSSGGCRPVQRDAAAQPGGAESGATADALREPRQRPARSRRRHSGQWEGGVPGIAPAAEAGRRCDGPAAQAQGPPSGQQRRGVAARSSGAAPQH